MIVALERRNNTKPSKMIGHFRLVYQFDGVRSVIFIIISMVISFYCGSINLLSAKKDKSPDVKWKKYGQQSKHTRPVKKCQNFQKYI